MWWKHSSGKILKLDAWINEKLSCIKWYNKMLIIGLAYFVGVGIKGLYLILI